MLLYEYLVILVFNEICIKIRPLSIPVSTDASYIFKVVYSRWLQGEAEDFVCLLSCFSALLLSLNISAWSEEWQDKGVTFEDSDG